MFELIEFGGKICIFDIIYRSFLCKTYAIFCYIKKMYYFKNTHYLENKIIYLLYNYIYNVL